MAEQSREPEILKSIIDDTEYNKTPQSRNEEILLSILNDTEYTKTPQSREEELLLELKDKIGHSITVESLSVTENGTYTAPAGTAYSPVEVNITPPQLVKRVTGNPVEFSDGADAPVVKCVTQITGSQDLHGYDKPWPPGAGKNKAITKSSSFTANNVTFTINADGSIKINGTADATGNVKVTDPITVSAGTTYTVSVGVSASVIGYGVSGFGIGTYTITPTNDYSDACVQVRTVSGTAYDTTIYPQLEVGSTATTFAPYSNICPITAYTEGEIVERGKNILDPAYKSHGSTNVYFYQSDGFLIEAGKTYTLSCDTVIDSITVNLLDSTKIYGVSDSNKLTFTPSEDMTVYFRFRNGDGISTINDFQLELGSSVTAYEPYTSTTHTTTYPSAIYRGSEDVVGGSVNVTFIKASSLLWSYSQTGYFYATPNPAMKGVTSGSEIPSLLCDRYETTTPNNAYSGSKDCSISTSTASPFSIWIRDNSYNGNVTDFANDMSNSDIVYELATPTTSSVTPTNLPLKTLFGYNHIESSTGEMVLDYITDKYQNFVDTVNRAVPSTRKSGSGAMEVFMSLEKYEDSEQDPEDVKGETR